MPQGRLELGSGIVRLYSHEEVVKYLRELSEYYQKESEKYGDKLGSMLRGTPDEPKDSKKKEDKKDDKKQDPKKSGPGGWIKMGSLIINTAATESANTEIMYQVHEDLKSKLARTVEAVKSFEQSANTLIPQNSTFELFLRNGVPERIVASVGSSRKASFAFDGKFRIV